LGAARKDDPKLEEDKEGFPKCRGESEEAEAVKGDDEAKFRDPSPGEDENGDDPCPELPRKELCGVYAEESREEE